MNEASSRHSREAVEAQAKSLIAEANALREVCLDKKQVSIVVAEANALAEQALDLFEQLETLEWFLRHRTAPEGTTQWEVYEQIDWSTHPQFASTRPDVTR